METQIGAKTCDSRTPIPSRPSMIAAEPREHTPEGAGLMPRSPTVVKDAHVIQNSADLLNIKVAVDSTDTNKEDMPSAERSCDIRNCTNKRDVSESPSTRNEAEPKKLRSQGHINTDPKLGVCPEGSYTADTQLVMGFVQSNRVQKMSPTRGQSDSTHTLSPTQVYSLAPIKDHGSDFTGQRIGISVPDSLIGLHQHSARDPACHADTNIIGPSALPSSLPGTQQASCQSQTAQEQPESTQIQGNSLPLGESQSVLSFTDSMFIEAENNFGTLMAQVVAKNDSYIIVESKEPQADIAPWVFTSAARPALSGSILGEAENNDMKVTEQAAGSASVETKDPRVSVEASTLTSPAARPEFTDSMFIEAEKNFMEIMAQAAPKRVVESKDPHAKINTITLTKSDGVSEHEVAALAEECIRDEVIQDAQTAPTTMPGFIMGGKVVVVSQQKLEESRAKFGPILSGLEALTASDDVCQLQSLRSTGNSTLRKNSYQPVGKDTPSMKGFGGIAPFKLPKFKNGGPNGPKSGFPINSEVANFTGISTSSMSTLQKPNISRKPMLRSRPLNNGTNIVCTDESTQQVTSWSAGLGKADATGIGLPVSGVLAMQLETIESAPGNRENRRVCEDCSILQTSSTGDNADEIARNGNFVMGGRNVVVDDKVILVAKGALGLQADKKAFETVNNEEEAIRRTALATGCETAKLIPPASATALQSSSRINAASFAPILRTAQANQSSGNEIGGHSAIPGIPSAVVVAVTPRHSRIQTSTAFKPPMPRLSLPKNDVNGTVMQSGVPRKRRSTRSSYQRRSIQRVHIRGSK
ncbi:hypothetical protein SARC_10301 [Sphaeroforma arctica JP610]|uniref:Uncharacterized protein n=1 Tax=Sphaeroforma arctica JP610 TaxID=667725 RepID=A0A0L0FKC9_9EUKA|nr:hypothetical protein SARC_10301 [Sphaeroforma arctica JP610]KNC77232.1 hypothetical protein SARC_10301 [Sphaeroforma arctica JP610]|eukprot:XP_014151134.1 hypothetical protein SARC_10301 [Sphaeroforma arctica JP610]